VVKKYFFYFSLALCSGFTCSTTLSVKYEQTRGFERVLERSWWMIHPLYGFIILRYSALLDNLFNYGDPKDPLIQVVQTLFHRDGEDGALHPSTTASNVACGLGPIEAGWLFAEALTKPDAFKNPTPYQLKRSKAKLSKDNALLLEKEIDSSILTLIEQIDKTHKGKIKEFSKEKKSVQGASIKKIFMLGDALAEARKAELLLKWRPKIGLILNSFVCATSNSRKDLASFIINGFASHGPSLQILAPYGKKLAASEQALDKFLLKKYTLSNLLETNNNLPFRYQPLNDELRARRFKNLALLLMRGHTQEPIFHMTLHDKGHADCAEAGILHLIVTILFDQESGILSAAHLPEKLQKRQVIKDFISIFNASSFNDSIVRHWWFDQLSHQKGIEYHKNNCSVRASVENIFAILNLFFGTEAKNWQELGSALSTKTTNFSFLHTQIISPKQSNDDAIDENETPDFTDRFMYPRLLYADQIELSIQSDSLEVPRATTLYVKRYANDSRHVEIVNERLELDAKKTNLILQAITTAKTPESIYTPLANWTHNEFSVFAIPQAAPKRELATILGRPLATYSFFELVRFMEYNKLKKEELGFIKKELIKPSAQMPISQAIVKWLSQDETRYKNTTYHPMLKKHANLFVQSTFLNRKLEPNQKKALSYALQTFFDKSNNTILEQAIRTLFSQSISTILADKVPSIIMEHLEHYPYNWCREAKLATLNNIQNHTQVVSLFIKKDATQKSISFSKDNPSMLYLLLQEAIDGTKEVDRKGARLILLAHKDYLKNPALGGKTVIQIASQSGAFKKNNKQEKLLKKLQLLLTSDLEKSGIK